MPRTGFGRTGPPLMASKVKARGPREVGHDVKRLSKSGRRRLSAAIAGRNRRLWPRASPCSESPDQRRFFNLVRPGRGLFYDRGHAAADVIGAMAEGSSRIVVG